MTLMALMQEHRLTIPSILDHAARWHGATELAGREDGGMVRRGWAEVRARALRMAAALVERLGVRPGERVATLGWNSLRHLELFYAVPGIGAVLHTVNPRLFEEQIRYIMAHAEDAVVFVEPDFLELAARLAPHLPSVRHWVLMADARPVALPEGMPALLLHDSLLERAEPLAHWLEVDERQAAGLCYTSGTTGNPKGVLYGHRSTVLHAMACMARGAYGIDATDCVMPIANMYHASAWGLPYVVPMAGARLVLPGSHPDPATLLALMADEGVTFAGGVPTIWTMLLGEGDRPGAPRPKLRAVLTGGSAVPPALKRAVEARFACAVIQVWGMTEMSPLGVTSTPTAAVAAMDDATQRAVLDKQGRPHFGIDLKLTDHDDGTVLPHDGAAAGLLWVRGPWVTSGYFGQAGGVLDGEGWFSTGDVATIDANGFLGITDRAKDVIKSGGEWISSLELEALIAQVEGVAMAAVIGVPHPKWEERPLALVVAKPGAAPDRAAIRAHLVANLARWQVPDDVLLVESLPLTATGKVSKLTLRQAHAGHYALAAP